MTSLRENWQDHEEMPSSEFNKYARASNEHDVALAEHAAALEALEGATGPVAVPRSAPLRWHRPDTTGWTELWIDDYETWPAGQAISLPRGGGNYVLRQLAPIGRGRRIESIDPVNLVWIAGEISIDEPVFDAVDPYGRPNEPDTDAYLAPRDALDLFGDFRFVYVEGLLIDGDYVTEGMDLFSGTQTLLVMQNCRLEIDPIVIPYVNDQWDHYHHIDCVQSGNGFRWYMSDSTFVVAGQAGMMGAGTFNPDAAANAWRDVEMHNVLFQRGDNDLPHAGWRLINFIPGQGLVGPIVLDRVYVDPGRTGKWGLGDFVDYHGTPWESRGNIVSNGTFWSGVDHIDPATRRHAWLPNEPVIEGVWSSTAKDAPGYFLRGRPPEGDFCPKGVAGLGYVLPDNVASEPFCISGKSQSRHMSHRALARTGTDFPNGGEITSRKWEVISGPTGLGVLTTNQSFTSDVFKLPGAYMLKYTLVTSLGTATSLMRLAVQVQGELVNVLGGDTRFDTNVSVPEWYSADNALEFAWSNSDDTRDDRNKPGATQITVVTGGDRTAILGGLIGDPGTAATHPPATTANSEHMGIVSGQMRIKQIAGEFRAARVELSHINTVPVVVNTYDGGTDANVTLTDDYQTIAWTARVPRYDLAVTRTRVGVILDGCEADDVFLVDDVVAWRPVGSGGDPHFDTEASMRNDIGKPEWYPYTSVPMTFEWIAGGCRVTITGNGHVTLMLGNYGYGDHTSTVAEGQYVRGGFRVKQLAGGVLRTAQTTFNVFDDTYTVIAYDQRASDFTVLSSDWKTVSGVSAQAPEGAAWVDTGLYLGECSAGDVFLIDDLDLEQEFLHTPSEGNSLLELDPLAGDPYFDAPGSLLTQYGSQQWYGYGGSFDWAGGIDTYDRDGIPGAARCVVTVGGTRDWFCGNYGWNGALNLAAAPGTTITGQMRIKQISGDFRSARAKLHFTNSDRNDAGTADGGSGHDITLSRQWQTISWTATMPAGGAFAMAGFTVDGAVGDVYLLDSIAMSEGAS